MSLAILLDHGSQLGLDDDDHSSYLKVVGADFSQFSNKGVPVSADRILIEDSADSFCKKRIEYSVLSGESNTASNIGATGAGVFSSKVGVDLKLRKVAGMTNGICISVSGDNIAVCIKEGQINHDNLLSFLATEHVDWAAAGAGTIHTDNYEHHAEAHANANFTVNDDQIGQAGVIVKGFGAAATTRGGFLKMLSDAAGAKEVHSWLTPLHSLVWDITAQATWLDQGLVGMDLDASPVKFGAPSLQVGWPSAIFTLPVVDGDANEYMKTDGAGAISWVNPATDHTHANDHAESHTVASHSDTTATGAELETLTDGSETALHSHADGGAGAPTGAVMAWGGNSGSPPTGYLYCDGSAVSRSTYSDLFAICSTRFGVGDGSTTFNLPNLKAKFPRGGCNADTCVGNIGGVATTGTHIHCVCDYPGLEADGLVEVFPLAEGCGTQPCGDTFDSAGGACKGHIHDIVINFTKSEGSHSNLPPYQNFHWIIKI